MRAAIAGRDPITSTAWLSVSVPAVQYKCATRPADDGLSCFELLGLDVLVDAELRPWLLEVCAANSKGRACSALQTVLDGCAQAHLIQHRPARRRAARHGSACCSPECCCVSAALPLPGQPLPLPHNRYPAGSGAQVAACAVRHGPPLLLACHAMHGTCRGACWCGLEVANPAATHSLYLPPFRGLLHAARRWNWHGCRRSGCVLSWKPRSGPSCSGCMRGNQPARAVQAAQEQHRLGHPHHPATLTAAPETARGGVKSRQLSLLATSSQARMMQQPQTPAKDHLPAARLLPAAHSNTSLLRRLLQQLPPSQSGAVQSGWQPRQRTRTLIWASSSALCRRMIPAWYAGALPLPLSWHPP